MCQFYHKLHTALQAEILCLQSKSPSAYSRGLIALHRKELLNVEKRYSTFQKLFPSNNVEVSELNLEFTVVAMEDTDATNNTEDNVASEDMDYFLELAAPEDPDSEEDDVCWE